MGRQRLENLHKDLLKERKGKREKEQELRSELQVSEDRWGDREWRTYTELSQKRERGREEKRDSRDLSNRSLKTDGKEEGGELQKGLQSAGDREREKASRDLPTDLRKRKRERAEIWKLVSEGRLGEGGYRPYKGV